MKQYELSSITSSYVQPNSRSTCTIRESGDTAGLERIREPLVLLRTAVTRTVTFFTKYNGFCQPRAANHVPI